MTSRLVLILATWAISAPGSVPALAQQSRCADCHYADPKAPRRDHVEEWDRSAHGRSGVGCEKCHGGNANVFEGFQAHRGVLNSADDSSSVNRRNLTVTCGQCHVPQAVAFEQSRHYQVLRSGDQPGPTCATCHGAVDGRVLSPKGLASACRSCHGAGERAPRAGRVESARNNYERLTAVRGQLKLAESLIKRVNDKSRRAELSRTLANAQAPLSRAIAAGHQFVYDDLNTYVATAQQRVQALLSTLSDPR